MVRIFIAPPAASPLVVWVIIAGLILVIGTSDYLSGTDASLAVFYLLPIMLITGWRGAQSGTAVAAVCSLTRFISDALATYPSPPHLSLFWNALSSFIIAVLVVWLLDALLNLHRNLESNIDQRTAELQEAVAVRARLERELLDAGSRERSAFGRELHDEIGQHLVATAFAVQALAQRLTGPLATEALAIVDWAEQAVAKTRKLARGLLLAEILPERLVDELEELSTAVSHGGAALRVYHDGAPVKATALECAQLFRIAQEAVNNATRHANAKKIAVSVATISDSIHLAIEDDGVGIAPQRNGTGMGLQIMTQRARMMGGELTVQKRSPRGTRVACVLPANRSTTHG